jgi:hypothetical protein
VQIADDFSDVKQVAIEGRQPLARLDVEPLQLGLRLVDGRVKQLPLSLLVAPLLTFQLNYFLFFFIFLSGLPG